MLTQAVISDSERINIIFQSGVACSSLPSVICTKIRVACTENCRDANNAFSRLACRPGTTYSDFNLRAGYADTSLCEFTFYK